MYGCPGLCGFAGLCGCAGLYNRSHHAASFRTHRSTWSRTCRGRRGRGCAALSSVGPQPETAAEPGLGLVNGTIVLTPLHLTLCPSH
eukprot:366559-Chlamydomonas_euryale.AAC.14